MVISFAISVSNFECFYTSDFPRNRSLYNLCLPQKWFRGTCLKGTLKTTFFSKKSSCWPWKYPAILTDLFFAINTGKPGWSTLWQVSGVCPSLSPQKTPPSGTCFAYTPPCYCLPHTGRKQKTVPGWAFSSDSSWGSSRSSEVSGSLYYLTKYWCSRKKQDELMWSLCLCV